MKTANILGVTFDNVTLKDAVDAAMEQIRAGKKGYVVTPNPEIAYTALQDPVYRDIINRAALVLPDGIGIIYAARILGVPLSGRVPGIDFADALMYRMSQEGMRLFLLGAKPGIAEKAAENLKKKYPGLVIAGTRDGYFQEDQQAAPMYCLYAWAHPSKSALWPDIWRNSRSRFPAVWAALSIFLPARSSAPLSFSGG